jgi:hypothetical protein
MDKGNIAKSVYLQFGAVGGSEVAAETSKFNAESKKAEQSAKSLAKEGGGAADFLREKFDGLKSSIAAIVGIAGTKALFDFSADGARLLDLQSNVDRLGISIGDLSETAGGTFSEQTLGRAAILADKLGKSLGLTAEQTQGLTRDAARLSHAFGTDLNDAVRQLFLAVSGETGGLKEAFGLFVDGQGAINNYALSVGKTADKLTDFEKRTAVANAIQVKLNGQLENAPIKTYADRLDLLSAKVDDFKDALKRAAAEMLLNPLTEAITGQYGSKFASSGNAAADRLSQARAQADSLREQLRTGKFETSGFFDVSTVDDRIEAERKLRAFEAAEPGLIAASVAEAKRLGEAREQARIDSEGDAANQRVLLEIGRKRIEQEEERKKAAEAAAQAAEVERKKQAEIIEQRRAAAALGRLGLTGLPEFLADPAKAVQAKIAQDRERGNAALVAALREAGAEIDARAARAAQLSSEIESRRAALLGEARAAGEAQAGRLGGFGGAFGGLQGAEQYGQINRFVQAEKDRVILPGEAERAQMEAFQASVNANIITPLEIAADASQAFTQGFAEAAAAAIVEGKGFQSGLQFVFKSLTKLYLVKAIAEQAEALASLAWGNVPGFIAHEKASGIFAIAAGASAIGVKVSGGSFGQEAKDQDKTSNRSNGPGARGVGNVNNNPASGSGSGQTVYNINVAYNGFTSDQKGHEQLIRMINGYGWRPGAGRIDPRVIERAA